MQNKLAVILIIKNVHNILIYNFFKEYLKCSKKSNLNKNNKSYAQFPTFPIIQAFTMTPSKKSTITPLKSINNQPKRHKNLIIIILNLYS